MKLNKQGKLKFKHLFFDRDKYLWTNLNIHIWMGLTLNIQNKVNDHTYGTICKSITIEIEKIVVNTFRICPKITMSWISRVASLGEERR
jgi:hypothetical protein